MKIKISFQQFLRRRGGADVQENEKAHPVNWRGDFGTRRLIFPQSPPVNLPGGLFHFPVHRRPLFFVKIVEMKFWFSLYSENQNFISTIFTKKRGRRCTGKWKSPPGKLTGGLCGKINLLVPKSPRQFTGWAFSFSCTSAPPLLRKNCWNEILIFTILGCFWICEIFAWSLISKSKFHFNNFYEEEGAPMYRKMKKPTR